MPAVTNYLIVGIDISKYTDVIRNDDKFVPYLENHMGYDMRIVDDTENESYIYFGKVLGESKVKTEAEIVDLHTISQKVTLEYKKVFNEDISLNDVKIISCSYLW